MAWLKELRDRLWDPLPPLHRKLVLALFGTCLVLLVVLISQRNQTNQVPDSWLSGSSASFGSKPTNSSQSGASASTSASGYGWSSENSSQINSVDGAHATVFVQVVGEVKNPGVYDLKYGSRVIDSIFAAGGFTAKADEGSVNLARPLNDGEQILVLPRSSASGSVLGNTAQSRAVTVNINLADAATLDSLPGIGPTLAQRIIDYRQANGGFRSPADLGKVAGIGPTLLARLKADISL